MASGTCFETGLHSKLRMARTALKDKTKAKHSVDHLPQVVEESWDIDLKLSRAPAI